MKQLVISLKNSTEVLSDFKKAFRNAKRNDKQYHSRYEISFDSKKELNKFLRNIDILSSIIYFKPKSIYELAKICRRDVSNLNKTILFLSKIGAIKIKKSKISGKETNTPIVEYDSIQFKLAA
ncbi:MAG: hypothetical protein AB1765_01765 [Candidatus Hydrogenedentota bacterium]